MVHNEKRPMNNTHVLYGIRLILLYIAFIITVAIILTFLHPGGSF